MKVYKVVRVTDSGLKSAFLRGNETVLSYAEGKTTKPLFGKCFAFKRLKDAQGWMREDQELWLCEAEGVEKAPERVAGDSGEALSRFKEWWEEFSIGRSQNFEYSMRTPPGTVFCSEITLLNIAGKKGGDV